LGDFEPLFSLHVSITLSVDCCCHVPKDMSDVMIVVISRHELVRESATLLVALRPEVAIAKTDSHLV